MGVDRCVASCARKVLVLLILYVLMRLRVAVSLCEAEVNDVHDVRLLAETHQEVLRLNVSVHKVLSVQSCDRTELQGERARHLPSGARP
jgi:hypothetical protein